MAKLTRRGHELKIQKDIVKSSTGCAQRFINHRENQIKFRKGLNLSTRATAVNEQKKTGRVAETF